MLGLLAVAFIVVPLAELAVIMQVGRTFGIATTLAALLFMSVGGAWLVRTQGLSILRSARLEMHAGRLPARQVFDGVLILIAGALLLTPGFLTDGVGLALLAPPVRAFVRSVSGTLILRRIGTRRLP